MLSKLIKHEFKATARYFLPLFVIVLLLTPITRLTHELGQFKGYLQFIPRIITFAYVASIMVIIAACILIIIYRFYKSMVTEEGYLMHTLPVTPAQHIWSKLLVSSFWSIASMLVVWLSLIIMFYEAGDFSEFFRDFRKIFSELSSPAYADLHFNMILIIIEVIILILIGLITGPLVFYASIAIGQVISKNKALGSIAGYFIIQFATQIITIISFIAIGSSMNDFFDPYQYSMDYAQSNLLISSAIARQILPAAIVFILVMSTVYFVFTNYVFKRKLNLE